MEINRAVMIVFSLFLKILDETKPEDRGYREIHEWAKSTMAVLNIIYPPDIYDGSSGDEGSSAIASIRKVIEK
ncbi:MAG: hypothetical protein ACP5L4_01910 [Thermoplasmata archaeon]